MRRLLYGAMALLACWFAARAAHAAELRPPQKVVAGTEFAIPTSGSGEATFYLVGPSHVNKRTVKLGGPIAVSANEVMSAGRYIAVLCSSSCNSAAFFVQAAKPGSLSFLTHPSRVPVAHGQAISAVVFTLDKFHNLITEPVPMEVQLSVKDAPALKRTLRSKEGAAWTLMDSSRKEGAAQLTATAGDVTAKRVVQQVASDPCNLRIHAQRTARGLVVETDPVRDCSGNAVPDGTIVSFTAVGQGGRSTVDAPIKKGIARAEIDVSGPTTISVASGVVLGNEIRVEGGSL